MIDLAIVYDCLRLTTQERRAGRYSSDKTQCCRRAGSAQGEHMTYSEMNAQLDGLRPKQRLLRSLQRQREEARAQIDCLAGMDYGKANVCGGEKTPAAERFVEHIEQLETKYEQVMAEAFELEDMISACMGGLTEIEQTILIDRYMSGKSWRKIQQEHHYEERQPYRHAESGIKKLAAAWNMTVNDSKRCVIMVSSKIGHTEG